MLSSFFSSSFNSDITDVKSKTKFSKNDIRLKVQLAAKNESVVVYFLFGKMLRTHCGVTR